MKRFGLYIILTACLSWACEDSPSPTPTVDGGSSTAGAAPATAGSAGQDRADLSGGVGYWSGGGAGSSNAGSAGAAEGGGGLSGASGAGMRAGASQGGELSDGDRDLDGVLDSDDNCPDVFNPSQSDIDSDFIGDACSDDADSDGIPDDWDPAPMDASWPGRSRPDTVYAHSARTLHALDVKAVRLYEVASFSFDVEGNNQITDIAIDRAGVLWAISYNTLWLCHPETGECRFQARLPSTNFNGLTYLPGALFGTPRDVLVGIEISGVWRRLDLVGGQIMEQRLGSYPSERSSGDVFSIEGVGTFAAVKRAGVSSDILVSVNPLNPNEITDVVTLEGYQSVYGLAGWRGMLFAFDESGATLKIDLETLEVSILEDQGVSWWGAGVSSVLRSSEPADD